LEALTLKDISDGKLKQKFKRRSSKNSSHQQLMIKFGLD
jgi:hypothetical protein